MRGVIRLLAGAGMGVVALAALAAESWIVGRPLVPVTLTDQHDRPHEVGPPLRLVLVSSDMDGGALVREALDGAPADTLANAGAVYIANIARMPGFVTRMFAVPRMRRRPYPVLLDRDGRATAGLATQAGRVVAVRLAAGTITAIEVLDSPAAVRRILGLE